MKRRREGGGCPLSRDKDGAGQQSVPRNRHGTLTLLYREAGQDGLPGGARNTFALQFTTSDPTSL